MPGSASSRTRYPASAVLMRSHSGSLGRVFDPVGVHNSDPAASERFYRTVLSVLDVEPSYAGADVDRVGRLVDRAGGRRAPGDPRAPRGAFRARDRAQVDTFWQADADAGYRDDGAPGCARSTARPTTAPSCSTQTTTASMDRSSGARAARGCCWRSEAEARRLPDADLR